MQLPRTLLLCVPMAALAAAAPAHAQSQCSAFAWNNPSPSYPTGVTHHTFRSASNGVDIGFNVYVPPGYDTSTARYPVIYYLHGKGGNEGTMVANVVSWMRQRVSAGKIRPAILVFANGAVDSGYADAKDGSRKIETSILRELIPHVDGNWRTQACREQRAISGFSMGGNGALLYAFKRPDLFSSVVAYAPALLEYAELSAPVASCMFGSDAAYYRQYQPKTPLAQNLDTLRARMRTRITVGTLDPLREVDVAMARELTSLGVANQLEEVAGCGHAHGCLWTTAGDRGVAVHEAAFGACGSAPTAVGEGEVPSGEAPSGEAPGDEAAPVEEDSATAGCSTGGGAGLGALAVVLFALARRRRRAALWFCAATTAACAAEPGMEGLEPDAAESAPSGDGALGDAAVGSVRCSAFRITGTPSSSSGATWTYQSTDDGVTYSLKGILLAPSGAGPFPAVVVSHGKGGSATSYSRSVGLIMRPWGAVVIATNYSHGSSSAGDLPLGAEGASPENLLRAHKAFDLLRCVPSVDLTRVAAHGHSMGAFVTTGLLGTYPADFKVASHSAGGINTSSTSEGAAPSRALAAAIRTPFQLHHGDADTVVPLAMDRALETVLTEQQVTHQLVVYPGVTHPGIATNATMLATVRAWYVQHGLL